jgi:hypothetical protein
LVPGQTYTIEYTHNATALQNTTVVRTQSGAQIVRMVGVPVTRVVADGRPFIIWFGHHEAYSEVPTHGASCRDLQVVFQR